MKHNWIIYLAFCALVCFPASGAERYAGEFLSIGAGARPLGMGGSFAAVADDATAVYWNPAGLGGLNQTQIAFMHTGMFGLDKYDFLGYVQPIGGIGTFGLSWIRLGINDIPMTELSKPGAMSASNLPVISGYMQDVENALVFSYGRRLRAGSQSKGTAVQIGGNVKFIYNSVSGAKRNALGLGGDIGLIWRASLMSPGGNARAQALEKLEQGVLGASAPRGDLSLGITAQDFFKTRIIWNTTSSPSHADIVPPNLKIGIAYDRRIESIGSQILFSIDANTRYGLEMRYGVEYVLGNILSLRVGVQERDLTAGAGLNVEFARGGKSSLSFLVDYAFLSHELGNSHRISLMTKF